MDRRGRGVAQSSHARLSRRAPVLAGTLAGLLACGSGAKGGTGPEHAAAPPAPAGPITKDSLIALARDSAAFRALVDPVPGVVDEHDVSTPAHDRPGPNEDPHCVHRRCADVGPLIEELTSMIVARSLDGYHESSCQPDDAGGDTCYFDGAAEYDVSYVLGFVAEGAGRRLAWVQAREVGSMGNDELDAEFEAERKGANNCL